MDDHATGRGVLQYANGNVYEGGACLVRAVFALRSLSPTLRLL